MIGLIMLLGLVVKNSILMVDFANRLRRAGMEKHSALSKAAAIRLRPILMTTMALVVGSLPAAIGLGEGAEIRRALSTVVIGGLLTSMFLTLLMVPTAYSLLDSFTVRMSRLFHWRPWRRAAQQTPALASATAGSSGQDSGALAIAGSNGHGNGHSNDRTADSAVGEPQPDQTSSPTRM